ncbi:MAG: ankyrin repeat domain-containing protein [Rhodospirillales bacterium]|nr:ankyrin repeat domain-containing protein [Rhodospirillales bacterium]MCB9995876.1 ankyrin repeat domain-containing protein [Rhodospirillales bacterium]
MVQALEALQKKLHDAIEQGDLQGVKDAFAAGVNTDQLYEFEVDGTGTVVATPKQSILRLAAKNGHQNIVRYLLEDRNLRDYRGGLVGAAEGNHIDILDFVVQWQAYKENEWDPYGLNAAASYGRLHMLEYYERIGADMRIWNSDAVREAAAQGHTEVVKFLHDRGADLNAESDRANKIYAEDFSPAVGAAMGGHFETLKYIAENGGDVHVHDEQALQEVAARGYDDIVTYLIDEHGADVDAVKGMPLRHAIDRGQKSTVKLLLKKGADVNVEHDYYGSHFEFAMREKQFRIARSLVNNGADVFGGQRMALRYAAREGQAFWVSYLLDQETEDLKWVGTPLRLTLADAVAGNHLSVVEEILKRVGGRLDEAERDIAAGGAAGKGYLEMLRLLERYSDDVRYDSTYALRQAARYGHLPTVKYLMEESRMLSEKSEESQKQAADMGLSEAASEGQLDIVKYFVEQQGVPVNKESQGRMYSYALVVAARQGHLDVMNYLQAQGAAKSTFDDYDIYLLAMEDRYDSIELLASQGVDLSGAYKLIKDRMGRDAGELKALMDKYAPQTPSVSAPAPVL